MIPALLENIAAGVNAVMDTGRVPWLTENGIPYDAYPFLYQGRVIRGNRGSRAAADNTVPANVYTPVFSTPPGFDGVITHLALVEVRLGSWYVTELSLMINDRKASGFADIRANMGSLEAPMPVRILLKESATVGWAGVQDYGPANTTALNDWPLAAFLIGGYVLDKRYFSAVANQAANFDAGGAK